MASRVRAFAAAALLLGLVVSALAEDTSDLLHRCRSLDGRWLLGAREAPPTLLLFDAERKLVKTWPVTSRNAQTASRVAAIIDAPTRRSFVVALRDVAEQAGLVWDAVGAVLKREGRLHLETY